MTLPELVRLSTLAKSWGTNTHSLVEASRRGKFCKVVLVGSRWFVSKDELDAYVSRQHATRLSPLDADRIRAAGEAVTRRARR